jgi:hypothetical protein
VGCLPGGSQRIEDRITRAAKLLPQLSVGASGRDAYLPPAPLQRFCLLGPVVGVGFAAGKCFRLLDDLPFQLQVGIPLGFDELVEPFLEHLEPLLDGFARVPVDGLESAPLIPGGAQNSLGRLDVRRFPVGAFQVVFQLIADLPALDQVACAYAGLLGEVGSARLECLLGEAVETIGEGAIFASGHGPETVPLAAQRFDSLGLIRRIQGLIGEVLNGFAKGLPLRRGRESLPVTQLGQPGRLLLKGSGLGFPPTRGKGLQNCPGAAEGLRGRSNGALIDGARRGADQHLEVLVPTAAEGV